MSKQKINDELKITIQLSEAGIAKRGEVTKSGEIYLYDQYGEKVVPAKVEREMFYQGESKVRTRSLFSSSKLMPSVGGLDELTGYESIFAIDTNSIVINDKKISAAVFFRVQVCKDNNKYSLKALDDSSWMYELHDVPEEQNLEMLAILHLANEVMNKEGTPARNGIAFVTDSNMASHSAISNRSAPIYKNSFLPEGFSLIYARDKGQELGNRLVKACHNKAEQHLKSMNEEYLKTLKLRALPADQKVFFRRIRFPGLNVSCPDLEPVSINEKTQITIYYR